MVMMIVDGDDDEAFSASEVFTELSLLILMADLTDSASEMMMMMTTMIMNILAPRLVMIILVLSRFFEIITW